MKTHSMHRAAVLWSVTALSAFQMAASGAVLTNRYSFTSDATDSVGGKNGTVVNATVSGGQVILNNGTTTSGTPSGQYVDLPDNLVSNYSSITMETWLTPALDDVTGGAQWARIWDFGNSDGVNGITGFMWMRVGNSSQGVRADIVPPGAGDVCQATATLLNGLPNHVVFTSDGPSHTAKIYINGIVVAENDNFVSTPAQLGVTTNDWLGRSQFAADPYMNASIDEFRIYQGALNPLEVAANFQNGPDTYPASYGTVTNIQIQVSSPMSVGSGAKAAVLAAADGLTNSAIDIAGSGLGVTYASGNTNVLTVDTNGNVVALSPGSTTVIASLGGLSSTGTVQVISLPTVLIHRWSFSGDLTDSVGGANSGSLSGSATIAGGKVMLDGSAGTYVQLPSYLISTTNLQNKSFTVETWATIYPTAGTWANLFNFGNSVSGGGINYAFMSPNAGGPNVRFAVGTAGSEDQANQGGNLNGQTNVAITCVYNPNVNRHFVGLYINGNLVGQDTSLVSSLAQIDNAFTFLGQSLFSADPNLPGEIDEFRIYDGELDKFQIAASAQRSPDNTNLDIGTFVSFTFNAGGSTIPLNQLRQSTAVLNFTAATNVSVINDATLTLTSSDTNVVTISSPGGVIRAPGLGTATLTAVYEYIVGVTTNSFTNSTTLTVVSPPAPTLVHRYSFTADASDSIGGADGVLTGGATISGGQVVLNGTDGYVDLPDGIIHVLTNNMTVEIWATDNGSGTWARFWDFGSAPGQPNMFLTRQFSGAGRPRFDWSTGSITSGPALTNGVKTHIVVVYDDADNSASMYMNGALVASGANAGLAVSSLNDTNNWFGRSQYADPYLNGSIDEVRIYSGLFTLAKVQADLAAGPDQLGVDHPLISASLSGSNLIVSWTTNGTAGFKLQSTAALGTGASWGDVPGVPVVSGANYQVTIPVTNSAQFFRLLQ